MGELREEQYQCWKQQRAGGLSIRREGRVALGRTGRRGPAFQAHRRARERRYWSDGFPYLVRSSGHISDHGLESRTCRGLSKLKI